MSESAFSIVEKLDRNIQQVVLGKSNVVQSLLISLIAGEHILLDDVPGVGKTLLAKALAKSIAADFHRIQFTPDLLPSDIIGSSLYRTDLHQFEFSPGPVFANVLLADEINRAPPRTQSALLEAMSEYQVTVDSTTHQLPEPFTVVATQNPFEFEGTYRLPESQLDRFLLRTQVGYPETNVERGILKSHQMGEPVEQLSAVATRQDVLQCQEHVRNVKVDDSVADYLLAIVEATRNDKDLVIGVSTRAALSFYRGCQARAITMRREYCTPDDVKSMAISVLSHRVVTKGAFQLQDYSSSDHIIQEILHRIPVPV